MADKNTVQDAHKHFISQIKEKLGGREAEAVARIVFEDVFGIGNFTRQDYLSIPKLELLEEIIARLLVDEPIQYIIGQADFYGLKLKVNPSVLIPRPETEELVHWILESVSKEFLNPSLDLLDIGTGSGCIPISLKYKCKELNIKAIDLSQAALVTAEQNARLHQCWVNFQQVDILDTTKWSALASFDIIVSNPPYIPFHEKSKMNLQVLDFEPELALFVENEDPLIFYKNIATFAKGKLKPGGQLYFETNEYNAAEVVDLLKEQNFKKVALRKDMSGKDRMIKAWL